uniref:RING-type domain-containing protein n=1 Tax=Ananas comosus var. bracteatus TaxID=296719 RepID=A0A6V7P1F1_ANACO|nr:unnamed protein product [Ananas comosus var. bracteatus]
MERVRQYVTTINGTSTLDDQRHFHPRPPRPRRNPRLLLLLRRRRAPRGLARHRLYDELRGRRVVRRRRLLPRRRPPRPFLPGSLDALSFDLDEAIAKRPPPHLPDTVLYKQELTILHTHIHDDRLLAIRDLLDEIGAATRLAGARCGACHALLRRELDFLRLPCSHAFHNYCIFKAFRSDTRCPHLSPEISPERCLNFSSY